MCDFCKYIGINEKSILTHELDVGDGNLCVRCSFSISIISHISSLFSICRLICRSLSSFHLRRDMSNDSISLLRSVFFLFR